MNVTDLFLFAVAVAAAYGLYIVGWLAYVRYAKQHGGGKSVTVNADGSVTLKRGGFIWQVVRFSYLLDKLVDDYPNNWKHTSKWENNANLCPLGARFLFGLTVFPFVILPIALLLFGLFYIGSRVWDLSATLNAKRKREKEDHELKETASGSCWYSPDNPSHYGQQPPRRRSLWRRIITKIGDVKHTVENWLGGSFPTGPTLFAGESFCTEFCADMSRGAIIGGLLLVAYVTQAVVSFMTCMLAWIIYGHGTLYWWEGLFVIPVAIVAVVVICGLIGELIDRKIKIFRSTPTGEFLRAWWQAKHSNLCPPVHFN